jgi:protoporphyrinogen oxidase
MNSIILGAGITGLSAGVKTGFPIYEASNTSGGICRTYRKNGYTFENGGGHWIFGSGRSIDFLRQFCDLKEYKRNAGIYLNNIIPYPIQTFLEAPEPKCEWSMKGWMENKFGKEACKIFFHPFNQKYTAGMYDLIYQDDPAKSPEAKDKGYNDTFCYPVGGLDTMIDRIAEKCTIHYGKRAIKIDIKEKYVQFSDDTVVSYDRLISTIPLDELLTMCGFKDFNLPYTSTLVLNIGAERGPRCPNEHWLYVPFCKSGFHRVGFYSNVDPMFAPEGKVSIYVEKSFNGTLLKEEDLLHYVYEVCDELRELGWIWAVEVAESSYIKHAYTWVSPGTDREIYLESLRAIGIDSIGRYGKWKFQGIAQSVEDGLNA